MKTSARSAVRAAQGRQLQDKEAGPRINTICAAPPVGAKRNTATPALHAWSSMTCPVELAADPSQTYRPVRLDLSHTPRTPCTELEALALARVRMDRATRAQAQGPQRTIYVLLPSQQQETRFAAAAWVGRQGPSPTDMVCSGRLRKTARLLRKDFRAWRCHRIKRKSTRGRKSTWPSKWTRE